MITFQFLYLKIIFWDLADREIRIALSIFSPRECFHTITPIASNLCASSPFGVCHKKNAQVAHRRRRIAIVSPEGVRQDISRFAWCHTTLYNMVNLLLRGVVLVNLGFHMCSQCLSMLIPFTNTHRANQLRLGELPSGESTLGQNDPIPRRHHLGLHRSVVCSLTACFARLSQ